MDCPTGGLEALPNGAELRVTLTPVKVGQVEEENTERDPQQLADAYNCTSYSNREAQAAEFLPGGALCKYFDAVSDQDSQDLKDVERSTKDDQKGKESINVRNWDVVMG